MKLGITSKSLVIGIILLAAGLLLGWILFGRNSQPTPAETTVSEHDHSEEKDTIWTCSMHPQIQMDKPGKCPICGMDLIPMSDSYEGISSQPGEVQMTEEAMKLAEVQTMVVQKQTPVKRVYLLGKVKPDERLIYSQTSHIPGRIEKLYINFTGEKVHRGQKLASIYSPELLTAQKELFEVLKDTVSSPYLLKAARNKLKLWKFTDEQIKALEKSGKVQTDIDILSDYDGYVFKRNVALGDHVKEGEELFEIVNLKNVWVMFEAYESDLPWIKVGDEVEIEIKALPGEKFKGKITYIDPYINPQTRIANVRVELPNPETLLKPDMFANGIIESKLKTEEGALVIPKSAVLWTGKRAVVYVKVPYRKNPTFLYREITLGEDAGDYYLVKDGLEEGEEIAVNGVFRIDAAAQLVGKPSMMNPEGGKASTGHHGNMKMSDEETRSGKPEKKAREAHLNFKVFGNCEMCKERIEGALKGVEGIYSENWDIDSKMMHVDYDPEKISEMEIHKRIAAVGHDTEKVKADDEVYNDLPGCCQYIREQNN